MPSSNGLYRTMVERGELMVTPGRTVKVPTLMKYALEHWGPPAAVGHDRYKEDEWKEALQAAGVPLAITESRGQGWKDGSVDVRRFRIAVRDRKLQGNPSLLMRYAIGGARVTTDTFRQR